MCSSESRTLRDASVREIVMDRRASGHSWSSNKNTCVLPPFSNAVDAVFPRVFDGGLVLIHGASRTPIRVK